MQVTILCQEEAMEKGCMPTMLTLTKTGTLYRPGGVWGGGCGNQLMSAHYF